METTKTTKLYPSQVNTKTISCRIPTSDYVGFLQDAISKGITLNDWLLMRIYSKSLGKVSEIEEKEPSEENDNEDSETYTYPIELESSWGYLTFYDESEIQDFLEDCYRKLSEAMKLYNDYRLSNIENDVKTADDLKSNTILRVSIFNSLKEIAKEIEWETPSDRKEILRDISNLYKDLF